MNEGEIIVLLLVRSLGVVVAGSQVLLIDPRVELLS